MDHGRVPTEAIDQPPPPARATGDHQRVSQPFTRGSRRKNSRFINRSTEPLVELLTVLWQEMDNRR